MVLLFKLQAVLWLCLQAATPAQDYDAGLRGTIRPLVFETSSSDRAAFVSNWSNYWRPSVFETTASDHATRVSNWSNWSFFQNLGKLFADRNTEEERNLQTTQQFPCRPARQPAEYNRTLSLPPARILECVRIATEEVFNVDTEIVSISYAKFITLEVLLLASRRGPSEYLEVIPTGDYAHYDAIRTPRKRFSEHSCLNKDQWCHAVQLKPIDEGLLVVDQHRVIQYNYTWIISGNTPASEYPKIYISQFGNMNVNAMGSAPNSHLYFPTAVALYQPYNDTYVSVDLEITYLIPHANSKLLFVTDTGNHRVVVLNVTFHGQLDYIDQFGETGVKIDASNTTADQHKSGFNWPYGIAVKAPATESLYEPTYANVFVVDRRNHRLVKLNLGYPLMPCELDIVGQTAPLIWDPEDKRWMCRRYDKPRLTWSSEYGRATDELNRPTGLTDPVSVGVYRHYVAVCEGEGNAITLLRVDHQPPYALKLVTYFKPQRGISLQGGMAVSDFGYIWYNYIGEDMVNYFSSMVFPESLRESPAPNRLEDYAATCINESWYDNLVYDRTAYLREIGFILNASRINWIFSDRPDFFSIESFNLSNRFDLDLLNDLVFNQTAQAPMTFCTPPTTPTPPPFLSGNDDGWVIDGQNQGEFVKRSNVARRSIRIQASMVIFWAAISSLFLSFHF